MTASEYRMTYDLHTHTVYSMGKRKPHGKGTVEENVAAAEAAGLKGIAISDHGPGHVFYGLDMERLPELKRDIEDARLKHPDVAVYLSVEANIVEGETGLDVSPKEAEQFDFIIAGYHYGVKEGRMVTNWLENKGFSTKGAREKLKRLNTEMTLKALYENDIKILTHPGDKYQVDMHAICRACQETKTIMELNTRHLHLTVDEIKIAKNYDVSFIISSDAHSPDRVGDFIGGIERAQAAGLELERIVNIERVK